MAMYIIEAPITIAELKTTAKTLFGSFLKAVVDVEKKNIALDAELHSDLESLLLDNDSKQSDLWGINLYLDQEGDEFIEFDSMINLRPGQGNMSRGVDDEKTRRRIVTIVNQWVKR